MERRAELSDSRIQITGSKARAGKTRSYPGVRPRVSRIFNTNRFGERIHDEEKTVQEFGSVKTWN